MRGLLGYAKYATFGMSWVLTTCVYLYLGYRGGQWLDARWETEPIFFTVGILLALVMSVMTLIKELLALTDAADTKRSSATGNKNAGDSEKNNFLNVDNSAKEKTAFDVKDRQDSTDSRGRKGRRQ